MNRTPDPLLALANAPEPAQWISLPELQSSKTQQPGLAPLHNPLLQVKARVQVCVGEAVMSVGDLLQAKVDDVLKLDRAIDDLVDLMVEGQVIARGRLVAVGEHFGIRISEAPVPLKG